MSEAPPNLQDYPGWFPAKLPIWRRRWMQVTTASVIAFFVGLGVGGSPSTDNMMSLQRAHTLADRAADDARAEAVADAKKDVLSSPEVLAALDQERERAQAELSETNAQAAEAQAKVKRQAKLLASARHQIRTLKQQKASAVATAQKAQQAARDAQQATAAEPEPAAASGTDPRFSYCYEANDAGYGPYFQGQDPEYDWYRDADNDGEVCE